MTLILSALASEVEADDLNSDQEALVLPRDVCFPTKQGFCINTRVRKENYCDNCHVQVDRAVGVIYNNLFSTS